MEKVNLRELKELIKNTESMDDKERKWWLKEVESGTMSEKNIFELYKILKTEKENLEKLEKEVDKNFSILNEIQLLEYEKENNIKKEENFSGNVLDYYREKIDDIDKKIIFLLSERFDSVKKIGEYKKKNNITFLQKSRWQKVLDSRKKIAKKYNLSEKLIENIWEEIHKEALKLEEEV